MGDISLLMPAIAFPIVLLAALGLSFGMSRLAFRRNHGDGLQPYACGEDIPTHMIQPDYGQFLPFAFFFTILHVVALLVTTVPVQTSASFVIAVVYLAGAVIGLSVLYGR